MDRHQPPLTVTDLPATGGQIGPNPEDFRVDEVAAYPLCGSGDHLFVRLEKRGWNTRDAVAALARVAHVRARDVGVAGMKDRHAVTSQWVSLPTRGALPPEQWELPEGLVVLEATRHKNKLRTGHLAGNRFSIRLEGVESDAASRARTILERLERDGLVNYFGVQRFGRGGTNVSEALAWLRRSAEDGRERFARKLFPSVLQAEVFNRYATARAAMSTDRALPGEVVRLGGSASVFVVEDPREIAPRLATRDVFLTGPIFGPKMKPARDQPRALEQNALTALGLSAEEVQKLGRLAPGTRRDLLVFPREFTVQPTETGLVVSFSLPAGSYATEVIRQLTGTELPEPRREKPREPRPD